jgi:hypothetical protein
MSGQYNTLAAPPRARASVTFCVEDLVCKNITNYIKAQILAWFGHVHRVPDNRMVKKRYVWSPALTKSLREPNNRWEDDVKSDITRMKITNWKDCIKNRIKCNKIFEKAKTSLKL